MTEKQADATPVSERASEAPQGSSGGQERGASTEKLGLRETILAAKKDVDERSSAAQQPKVEKAPKKEVVEDDDEGVDEKEEKSASTHEKEPGKEVKKPERETRADEGESRKEKVSTDEKKAEDKQPQAASSLKPPASWSESTKAEWDRLPPSVQSEVLKREDDTARGVEKLKKKHSEEVWSLKNQYSELDNAISPYDHAIRISGQSRAQVVKRMFDWNMALAGPKKLEAFRELADSFGVDLRQITGTPTVARQAQADVSDPNVEGQIQQPAPTSYAPNWEPTIARMASRMEQIEREGAAYRTAQAENLVQKWSADKPHFETVRVLMAQLVDNDVRNGGSRFFRDGQIDMDAAYEAAMWADPSVRNALIQDQRSKQEAAVREAEEKAKAAMAAEVERAKKARDAEKARRAAASIRPNAPLSALNGSGNPAQITKESVRESIKRAWQSANER